MRRSLEEEAVIYEPLLLQNVESMVFGKPLLKVQMSFKVRRPERARKLDMKDKPFTTKNALSRPITNIGLLSSGYHLYYSFSSS
jgi:hypothetical protein